MTSTTTAEPSAPAPKRFRGGPWGTLVAIAFGVMMVALDGTIVAVANPVIGADLNASLAELQWVTHGYLLGLAVFLITAGKLGDRFGHRRMYMIGVVGFMLTSVAIALSSGVILLVAFRVLQGVFGAIIAPAAMGLLRSSFPPHMLGRAFGVFGSLLGGATAAGPIVGGFLVGVFGWQSVFYINVPVGLLAVGLGVWLLAPNRAVDAGSRLDAPGILLLSVAIFALVWALVEAPTIGWAHPETLLVLALALVFAVAFALREHLAADPLLPLGIFRSSSVSIGTVLMILMALGLMGSLFFVTFYLQGVHGMSPIESGLQLLPMTAMMAVGSPLAGRLMDRVGTRVPTAAGLTAAALGLLVLSQLATDSGVVHISAGFVLLGGGLSFVMTGATAAIIGNAPVKLAGVASGMQQAAMQLGGSLGTAVLGALLSVTIAGALPGHFADAGLPRPDAAELAAMQGLVSQGAAAVPEGASAEVAAAITGASHLAFMDGMHLAFGVSAVVMFLAALLSLAMKPAPRTEQPAVHV
ncbi:EmrB/QacA subfamily drug resistance transporter [Spinactinospora alkalitolerans]|uniref:EmrB/QacA subfamily drug resistance transporter n=1 Tax=Spinactinospora alkalitolerans TaxID=687207 RepID=A0A852TTL7_9ACTN|nr:MFS transporter [Spinactinospora alkalitolerans]NYE46192.1 EmrB/QacA subfamily drug resistance transporter [Spinactinospora alkalitolerans]